MSPDSPDTPAPAPWFGAGNVAFSRENHLVLAGADIAVERGEIHALVGVHNAGKSTLCAMLEGALSPDSGEVFLAGQPFRSPSPRRARELGVARVTGVSSVFPHLTVMENLVAGQESWWLGLAPRGGYERRAGGWLGKHDIELPLERTLADLPREYWIVVDILSCLFRAPRLLILDDVMEEISPRWQRQLLAVLRRQVGEGMSAIWVTQQIEDALTVADSVTVMRQGRTILTDRADNMERFTSLSEELATVGLLAAGVAHEVNNPLEIIGNYLNYLDGEPLSAAGKKALGKMEVEVGHIQQIVSKLVAHSGRKAGEAIVDPALLIRELVELLQAHMRPRNISFVCEEPDGPLSLAVDSNELRQIFINLVRNSLDAMTDNGLIRFTVSRDDRPGMARIRFTDSGGGISLENPNNIFLPFVTTKKQQGSHQGLGLYVVYGIIEGYGGTIEAENLPEGGCRFTLRLPLAEPADGAAP